MVVMFGIELGGGSGSSMQTEQTHPLWIARIFNPQLHTHIINHIPSLFRKDPTTIHTLRPLFISAVFLRLVRPEYSVISASDFLLSPPAIRHGQINQYHWHTDQASQRSTG